MSVEFIGYTGSGNASEIHPPSGPAIDREWIKKVAQAHEAGGFDRVLIAQHSTGPDSQIVTSYVAAHTKKSGFCWPTARASKAPHSPPANSPASIISPKAASPSTSSPAAPMPKCNATAIFFLKTSATSAPMNIFPSSAMSGLPRNLLTMKANIINTKARFPK